MYFRPIICMYLHTKCYVQIADGFGEDDKNLTFYPQKIQKYPTKNKGPIGRNKIQYNPFKVFV